MAIPWNEDDSRDAALIVQNLTHLLRQIARRARHRQIYKGVSHELLRHKTRLDTLLWPDAHFIAVEFGKIRVTIADLARIFEEVMGKWVAVLDPAIPAGGRPADPAQLRSVLTLCAYTHGEWVRIHPFANGNGRTAPSEGSPAARP